MNRFIFALFILVSSQVFGQESARRPIHLSTEFDLSYFHFGGYGKERSIVYLEQSVDYEFENGWQVGGSLGINAYPGLLALPIGAQVRIPLFPNGKRSWMLTQAVHRNLGVANVFYIGNRYRGSLSSPVYKNDKIQILPELGYSLIWDRFGGMSLSLLAGIRLTY